MSNSQRLCEVMEKINPNFNQNISKDLESINPETREYGKKVLSNYYIYNNYLNSENKITFSTIFQSLVSPY